MPACLHCSNTRTHKDGRDRARKQRYRCSACRRSFTARTGTPFTNHRWPRDVIVMAVRWYFCYRLSAANVRNLLAERGLDVSRQTVAEWAQKFGVLLTEAGRHHAKPLGMSWFVDETYVRVGKAWAYLYRAGRVGASRRRAAACEARPRERRGLLRASDQTQRSRSQRGRHRQAPGVSSSGKPARTQRQAPPHRSTP